jgi:hypothetical protein
MVGTGSLLTDWDEMSNLHRGPSINASYQVSVHLAKGFQRRRLKCEKLTRRRTTDAKWWQKLTLLLARWANNSPQVDMSLHSDTLLVGSILERPSIKIAHLIPLC